MKWSDVESTLFSKDELENIDQFTHLVSVIIKERNRKNLTQQALANKAGLKQSAVARFESLGAIPRIDTLCKLAKALELEVKLESVTF